MNASTLLRRRPLPKFNISSSIQVRTLARMTLIGRLAAPPEVAVVANDRSLVRYAVGVNTGQQQTSWFRVSHFPPTDAARDFMAGLQKGQMVAVEADSKIQAYSVQEGEAAGQQRKTIQLRQRSLELLGARPRPKDTEAQEDATNNADAEAGDATA